MTAPVAVAGTTAASEERLAAARSRIARLGDEYPFTPRFLEHDGVYQHYVDEGSRDADPVLFVHGNPTWSFAWRRPIVALRDRWRCVAVDHVGCGLSDKPQDWTYRLERHVENLERLVLALDLRRITLVVHDWGGAIGLGMARRLPERIARLVITNTAAFRAERMPLRLAACRVPVFGRLAVRGLNAFARAATTQAVARPLSPAAKRGLLLPYDSWKSRIATIAFVEDIPMDARHPSMDELRAIEGSLPAWRERPVAIVWGERDWCFTPAFRERWEAMYPHASVTRLDEAAHYLFEDAPAELIAALEAFLASSS